MILMLSFTFEGSGAKFTNVPYSLVFIHVLFVMTGIYKTSFTFVTLVFELTRVHPHVSLETVPSAELFMTSVTHQFFLNIEWAVYFFWFRFPFLINLYETNKQFNKNIFWIWFSITTTKPQLLDDKCNMKNSYIKNFFS